MEESVNIEFLYGGCLPLQPGSQLSYTPILNGTHIQLKMVEISGIEPLTS